MPRYWYKHQGITVHRVGYDHPSRINLGDNAIDICAHFTGKNNQYPEVAKATGGQLAYTIMIGAKINQTWQCLPLSDTGHHARRWSSNTIGIAAIGDFRFHPPTHEQYWALVDSCAIISRVMGTSSAQVLGHDERPGGRRNKSKECPGKLLDMKQLRHDINMVMRGSAERQAVLAGLVP